MSEKLPHIPILVAEIKAFFEPIYIRYFVDGTLGAGGHASMILEEHAEIEQFYGIDKDPEAMEIARECLKPFQEKVKILPGDFRKIKELVPQSSVNGIFLDLGVSSMQLDRPEKGFSFMREGPLDMRMDPEARLTASEVINRFSKSKLEEIFRDLGEEPRYRQVAAAIIEARRKKPFQTTAELAELLKKVCGWKRGHHPATLVFQALRIYVNDELNALKEGLFKAIDLLAPQGRLGVLTFHSLEDRIVKHLFKDMEKIDKVSILTKKPLSAELAEVKSNPRSRSAKFRGIEKL